MKTIYQVVVMYKTNHDLPLSIRQLAESTQDLYRAAFNSAIDWYGEESKAHRMARSAIRNQAARLASRSTHNAVPFCWRKEMETLV